MSNEATGKRVELILQQLEELPTLPDVAVRLLETTARETSNASEVAQLLESDPSLTAKILSMVRASDLGVRGEVDSVQRAVSLLGFEAVRSAALSVSVFQTFTQNKTQSGAQFDRDAFWKHSLAVACCAELLAKQIGKIVPSDAFVCGLLHDLGKVALDTILPKSFNRVVEGSDLLRGNIADLERNIIGLDHQVVGKRLAEKWNLPGKIRDCIWLHGQLPEAIPATVENPGLINLISLADLLVREQHIGYSGNYQFNGRSALIESLKLNGSQIEAALKELVAQVEPRAIALGLGQSASDDIYREALTQANKELNRIGSQLSSKNRRLEVRSKYFNALSSFQGELRADASQQAVLQAIAQTAAELLNSGAVAAFSLPPRAKFAEAVIVDAAGQVFDTTLIDGPEKSPQFTMGDGPVQLASNELEWFVSAISPRLSNNSRYWIALTADNDCIGGVVWGAAQGEAQRLGSQVQELSALSQGWSLAIRTAQIREESRNLSEQLAESNRRLQGVQNELFRSRTIVTVGEMAAGAAHEMNNPLAVISGRSQLLASQLADPKLKHAASLIHEQSHRLSEIITDLMDFAKPEPPRIEVVDLPDLVSRSLYIAKTTSELADRTIEVTLTDVPPVLIDEKQVAAAVTELISNSLQATDPKKGHIEIHAAFDSGSSQVVLTIADNGPGMDEQTLKRAFDPFFSSKLAGRRRGMGLAKALRWVEASGGSIRLESRPDQGTRSIVLLPVSSPDAGDPVVDEIQLHGRKAQ